MHPILIDRVTACLRTAPKKEYPMAHARMQSMSLLAPVEFVPTPDTEDDTRSCQQGGLHGPLKQDQQSTSVTRRSADVGQVSRVHVNLPPHARQSNHVCLYIMLVCRHRYEKKRRTFDQIPEMY